MPASQFIKFIDRKIYDKVRNKITMQEHQAKSRILLCILNQNKMVSVSPNSINTKVACNAVDNFQKAKFIQ